MALMKDNRKVEHFSERTRKLSLWQTDEVAKEKDSALSLLSLKTPGRLGEKRLMQKEKQRLENFMAEMGGWRGGYAKLIFFFLNTTKYSHIPPKGATIWKFKATLTLLAGFPQRTILLEVGRTFRAIHSEFFLPSHLLGRKTWYAVCN